MFTKMKELYSFLSEPLKTYSENKNFKLRTNYARCIEKGNLDENMVFYESYHGKNATGNPYALFMELQSNEDFKHLHHVWALNDLTGESAQILNNYRNVILVERETPDYVKYLAKAKYLINDTSFPYYFQKLEEQVYINTWHGTPLKMIGADVKGASLSAHGNIQRNLLHVDYLVSPNKFTYKKLIESNRIDGLFQGKIIDAGYPRTDRTLNADSTNLKKTLGIDESKKVILYAPTWREYDMHNSNLAAEGVFKYFEEMKEDLSSDYEIILKVHYFIYAHFKKMGFEQYCIPDWVDTNELLSCVDILITDYSSVFFDFLPTKKPILFFAYDLEKYAEERGLYLDVSDLPGPICENIRELISEIEKIGHYNEKYGEKYQKMIQEFSYYDDGFSSKRIVDIIFNGISNEHVFDGDPAKKEKILIWGGGFGTNGITTSLINLLNNIDYSTYDVALMFASKLNEDTISNLIKVNENVKILYRVGTLNYRFIDFYKHRITMNSDLKNDFARKSLPLSLYERELKRVIGNTKYNIAIDYCGYTSFWSLIFVHNKFDRKVIYLHSDMQADAHRMVDGKFKHEKLKKITFNLYEEFDNLICVSKDSWRINKDNFTKPMINKKMIHVNNALDFQTILNASENVQMFEQDDETYLVLNNDVLNGKVSLNGVLIPKKENINFVTVGRLSPEKDHAKLIRAFAKIHEQFDNSKLYIVGDGPLKNNLTKLINSLGLSEDVFLVGNLTNPFALVDLCDCFILSSNYEGQGLVILEALVLGKPVISTDIAGPKGILKENLGRLVENSETGLIFGMMDYILNKPSYNKFDYMEYNEKAMKHFYEKVCDSKKLGKRDV